jgi:hypothetical protein
VGQVGVFGVLNCLRRAEAEILGRLVGQALNSPLRTASHG